MFSQPHLRSVLKYNASHRRAALALTLALATGTSVYSTNASADGGSAATSLDAPAPDRSGRTRTKCLADVDRRVADLATWQLQIDAIADLSSVVQEEIRNLIYSTSEQLISVARPSVEFATTKAEVAAACRSVVIDYRVYALVRPQAFTLANSDAVVEAAETLAARLDRVTSGVGDEQISSWIDGARNGASDVRGLLGLTVADYNADPDAARGTLASARTSVNTARTTLKRAEVAIVALEAANPNPSTTSSSTTIRPVTTTTSTRPTTTTTLRPCPITTTTTVDLGGSTTTDPSALSTTTSTTTTRTTMPSTTTRPPCRDTVTSIATGGPTTTSAGAATPGSITTVPQP
jgi:hypothetical protein